MPKPHSKSHTRIFFNEKFEWSERKHRLLRGYLESAVKVMGSMAEPVYVDGFAGAGQYGDGSDGSPLIAARMAQEFRAAGKPYAFRCINVEPDPMIYANLVSATAAFTPYVTNMQGYFADTVDNIVRLTDGHPVVCFLDPFGLKGIAWTAVEKLIRRGSPTDLWIRFDQQMCARLDGFFDSHGRMAEANFNIVAEVYGIPDRAALHAKLDPAGCSDRYRRAVDYYEERLAQAFAPMRGIGFAADYHIRTKEGEVKYPLVFATGNRKGAIIASSVVYAAEEAYQREVADHAAAQPQQLSWLPLVESAPTPPTEEERIATLIVELSDALWQRHRGHIVGREDAVVGVFDVWFGRAKDSHYNAAFKKLIADGRITQATGAPSNRMTYFTFRR